MATNSRPSFSLDRFIALVRAFPLVPIEAEKDLDRAMRVVDGLLDKERSTEEEAYLEVLSGLVERYEEEVYAIEPATDAAALADLLESRGLSQARAARELGIAESTISEVLSGDRKLTRAQIGKVAAYFKVSPELFDFRA
ncbi:MAG: helix-turn-helix domain-containing protein [Planctomycetes bacterium]|nr:helix-turn-helix domain-containing protein [Planctomycetota bacterium]